MTVTITLEGALIVLLAALAMVLMIYLIVLIRKAIVTLTKLDSVLDDTKVVSQIASDKAKKMDKVIDGIGDSVGTVADSIKGNKSIVAAVTSVINAAGSIAGIVKKPTNNDK